MTCRLLELPPELIDAILVQVDPLDLVSLRCCRTLDQIIKNNEVLFKKIYLSRFVSCALFNIFPWVLTIPRMYRLILIRLPPGQYYLGIPSDFGAS